MKNKSHKTKAIVIVSANQRCPGQRSARPAWLTDAPDNVQIN